MRGHVALTDVGWYSFLRDGGPWDEVNFWQPGGKTLLNLPLGAPFFFKLHAPHGGGIVGYGHFSWRSKLPAWMAWDSFQQANGAIDRDSFLRLLAERRGEPFDPSGSFEIGCLLISRPTFFGIPEAIAAPRDWPRSGVQQGKGYSLEESEGRRIYEECRARTAEYPESVAPAAGATLHRDETEERFGRPYLTRPRLGQGGFRVAVTDSYRRACAICGEHSLPVLEAAHIRRYADGGGHDVSNGILLRADIHRLFDQGLVTVTPDHQFLVSDRLRRDYQNGQVYYELQERVARTGRIELPNDPSLHPDPELLRWHSTERFVA